MAVGELGFIGDRHRGQPAQIDRAQPIVGGDVEIPRLGCPLRPRAEPLSEGDVCSARMVTCPLGCTPRQRGLHL